jgi:hypothetical protein
MPPKRKFEENLEISQSDSNISNKKQKIEQNTNKIANNIYDWRTSFPTVFDIFDNELQCPYPKTALEKEIMNYSRTIRSHSDWHEKIKLPEFVAEMTSKLENKGVDDAIITYVFAELKQHYADLIDGSIFPALADGVYQADNIISEELKNNLLQGTHKVLSNEGESNFRGTKRVYFRRDNPQSDVINPTLCCLHKEESSVQEEPIRLNQIVEKDPVWTPPVYDGRPISEPKTDSSDSDSEDYSINSDDDLSSPEKMNGKLAKYQWLPADFYIDDNGKVTIESYINNLHPVTYSDFYDTIGKIFEQFIPLFNKTLTDVLNPRPNSIQYEDFDDEIMALNESQRSVTRENMPEVPEFRSNKVTPRAVVDLKGRRVQVIVELLSWMQMEPSWKIDGLDHERIIATGIYCYESNDVPLHIEFNEVIAAPFSEPRDTEVFGFAVGCPLIQQRGFLSLKTDRCAVYPNLWRQRPVWGTKENPTASLLKFYLVDLATPIISTKNVVPQQSNWLLDHRSILEGTYLATLPPELLQIIFRYSHFGWDYPTAISHKKLAVEERKKYTAYSNWKWNKRTYGTESNLSKFQ